VGKEFAGDGFALVLAGIGREAVHQHRGRGGSRPDRGCQAQDFVPRAFAPASALPKFKAVRAGDEWRNANSICTGYGIYCV
jgi:hypothetical protein